MFAHRLAAKLGRVNVGQMLSEITTKEFVYWIAFWNLEPFGDEWRRTANLGALLIQPHLKEGKMFTPEDMMPGQRDEPDDDEELSDRIFTAFAALGARPAGKPFPRLQHGN